MKKHSAILVALLALCVAAIAADVALRLILTEPAAEKQAIPSQGEEEAAVNALSGNDRDAHGCIGSAGYQWCQAKGKCLRIWEETCSITAQFKCAMNKAIKAEFESLPVDQAKLILSDGRRIVLPRAISGSGARYANADESQVFWNKGGTAWLAENGKETFRSCQAE